MSILDFDWRFEWPSTTARRTMAALGGIPLPEDKLDGEDIVIIRVVRTIVVGFVSIILGLLLYNAHANIVLDHNSRELAKAGLEQTWDSQAGRIVWKKVR